MRLRGFGLMGSSSASWHASEALGEPGAGLEQRAERLEVEFAVFDVLPVRDAARRVPRAAVPQEKPLETLRILGRARRIDSRPKRIVRFVVAAECRIGMLKGFGEEEAKHPSQQMKNG